MKPVINQVILSGHVKAKPELKKDVDNRTYAIMRILAKSEIANAPEKNRIEEYVVLTWDNMARKVVESAEVGNFVVLKGTLANPNEEGKCDFVANKVFLLEMNE